jgi:hypothetical protein
MLQDFAKRIREWQEIAAEAAKATDQEKLPQSPRNWSGRLTSVIRR